MSLCIFLNFDLFIFDQFNKGKKTPCNYVHELGTWANCNYDPELLPIVLKMVQDKKCTLSRASKKFGIPKSTLYRRLKKGNLKNYGLFEVFSF